MLKRLWLLLREEGGWGRVWTGLAIGICLAGGGLVYQQVTAGGNPALANLWVDTNGGTCTRTGGAGAAYNDAAACSSFSAAHSAASAGDMVRVKGGTYGAQTISADKGSPNVTFAEASGETVDVDGNPGSYDQILDLTITGGHVTLRDMHIEAVESSGCASFKTGVRFENMDLEHIYLQRTQDFVFDGGDIGPTYASSGGYDGHSQVDDCDETAVSITRSGSTATVTHTSHGFADNSWVMIDGATQTEYNGRFQITVTGTNTYTYTVPGTPATPATGAPRASKRSNTGLVFDGVLFHDATWDGVAHTECLLLTGAYGDTSLGSGVTIKNSTFTNCNSTGAFFITRWLGTCPGGEVSDILLENNFFLNDPGQDQDSWLQMENNVSNFYFINNTWTRSAIRFDSSTDHPECTAYNDVEFPTYFYSNYGRLGLQGTCTGDGNVWVTFGTASDKCTGEGTPHGGSLEVVNEATDLHLSTGSFAIDNGNATQNAATDIDGTTRPLGSAYDAGADEKS